ncbi:MAG: endolytic transglycosylase MltG [Marmoricola sp.]
MSHSMGSDYPPSRGRGIVIAVIALIVLGVVAGLGLKAIGVFDSAADYPGPGYGSVLVQVHKGDTATAIGHTLAKADVVESSQAFVNAAKANSASAGIQVCYYRLKYKMKASAALALLINPANCVQSRVTVIEGERVADIVADVASKTSIKAAALRAALARPSSIGLPAAANGNPEGYLFPATYPVTPGETATQLLSEMVARANSEFQQLNVDSGASALNLTPEQVITVASILQWEAKIPSDFPKVARTIYNRLAAGMPLQSDATVAFANGVSGRLSTTNAERANPSRYNTYVHKGLPPGPIGSPGEVAIKAALHPAQGPWLYWVVVNPNTGETVFSTTYAEHQAAVAQWQAYCAAHTC